MMSFWDVVHVRQKRIQSHWRVTFTGRVGSILSVVGRSWLTRTHSTKQNKKSQRTNQDNCYKGLHSTGR